MELVFEDDFDTLDRSIWSLRDRWVTEDSFARPDWRAVKLNNSKLRLFAMPDPARPGKFLNGHIGTEGAFEFTYGYVEARVKFHPYTGSHGAPWLQSKRPYEENNPEVDIAEYFGKDNPWGKQGGDVWHNVYPKNSAEGAFRVSTNDLEFKENDRRWWQSFNTFGCLWTPNGYAFLINDVQVAETTIGASSSPKYLCLSMITRTWEAADFLLDKKNTYKMSVDWVRVWQ